MTVIIGTVLYKLAALLVGFGLAYLGYRLFLAGIFEGAGDLDATFSDTKLILKKGSPGIFFALFGTVVLVATLTKGLDISTEPAIGPPPLVLTGADKIAIQTIEELVAGHKQSADIIKFEKESVLSFLEKVQQQAVLVSIQSSSGKAARGIASEDE